MDHPVEQVVGRQDRIPPNGTVSHSPPARTSFATTDPERVGDYVRRAFGPGVTVRAEEPEVHLRVEGIHAGSYRVDDVALSGASVTVEPHPVLVVARLLSGSIDWRQRRAGDRFGIGDVVILGDVDVGHRSRWYDAGAVVVTLTAELIQRVAADDSEARVRRVRFTGRRPVSPAAARQWLQTVGFVTESITNEEAAASRLVIGSAGRLLAATALATFPNTSVLDDRRVDRSDATSETVRRALAFIESNADLDIGVEDIAQARCVTARAVQLAFRRHLDTTPMAELRRVRLARAHDDLRNASPDDGTTVTLVAARWGFPSPSRFSSLYRGVHGRLPSQTLRGDER
ncbi:MAG: helix-turn-helix transcriptional regulator [Intrasporangium sp.]|uniref:helix-turn-helix transcriptional regulator n=1 Tax=Intrasporangium sp. TaxID=1925024 RepID=UPI003F7F462D